MKRSLQVVNFLLLVTAVISALGTFTTFPKPFPFKPEEIYRQWWFLFLLGCLAFSAVYYVFWKILSLMVPGTAGTGFGLLPNKNLSRNVPGTVAFSVDELPQNFPVPFHSIHSFARPIFETIKTKGFKCVEEKKVDQYLILASKNKWGIWTAPVLHAGIVLILFGGFLTFLFSDIRDVMVPEGEILTVPGTSEKIRLEKFSVILHPGKSQPEEYISHLLVERHNGQIKRHDLKVNHPVMIGFTKLFQMRYRVEILRIDLRVYRNKTLIEHLSLKPGESKTLSEETFSIRIDDVIPDFTMNKEGKVASRSPYFQNPAVLVTIFGIDPSGERKVWAFQDLVPHEKDKEEWSFSVEKIKKRYISGIKLSRDPGVPLAYSGFILLIFGAFVASFVIPRELILSFSPALDGKETRMEIQGYKTKDTFGLQRELKSLSARVANILTGKDS